MMSSSADGAEAADSSALLEGREGMYVNGNDGSGEMSLDDDDCDGDDDYDDVNWEVEQDSAVSAVAGENCSSASPVDEESTTVELTIDDDNNFVNPGDKPVNKPTRKIPVRYTDEDRALSVQRHQEELMCVLLDISNVAGQTTRNELLLSVVSSLIPLRLMASAQQQSLRKATKEFVNDVLQVITELNFSVVPWNSMKSKCKRRRSGNSSSADGMNNALLNTVESEKLVSVIASPSTSNRSVNIFQLTQIMASVFLSLGIRVRVVYAVGNMSSCHPQKHPDIAARRRKIFERQKLKTDKIRNTERNLKRNRSVGESGQSGHPSGDVIDYIMSKTQRTFEFLNRRTVEDDKDNDNVIGDSSDPNLVETTSTAQALIEILSDSDEDDGKYDIVDRPTEDRDMILNSWLEVCVANADRESYKCSTSRVMELESPRKWDAKTGKSTTACGLVDLTDDDDNSDAGRCQRSEGEMPPFDWLVIDPTTLQICSYPLFTDPQVTVNRSSNSNIFGSSGSYSYVFAVVASSAEDLMQGKSLTKMRSRAEVKDISWKYIAHLQAVINSGDRRLSWADSVWLQSLLGERFAGLTPNQFVDLSEDGLRESLYWQWDETEDVQSTYHSLLKINMTALPTFTNSEPKLSSSQYGGNSNGAMSLASLKGHPRYVLQRHLAVDEIVVPPFHENVDLEQKKERVVQCYLKGEAVFLRSDVQKLKTKMKWLREDFRVVRDGETPVRVLTRKQSSYAPSVHSNTNVVFGDSGGAMNASRREVKLFGRWQTELMQVEPMLS
jgi:hypothetical protein